jgi:hypothetical protein
MNKNKVIVFFYDRIPAKFHNVRNFDKFKLYCKKLGNPKYANIYSIKGNYLERIYFN